MTASPFRNTTWGDSVLEPASEGQEEDQAADQGEGQGDGSQAHLELLSISEGHAMRGLVSRKLAS